MFWSASMCVLRLAAWYEFVGEIRQLRRQRLARRIALKRMHEDGVSAMLRALSDQEPPVPLV